MSLVATPQNKYTVNKHAIELWVILPFAFCCFGEYKKTSPPWGLNGGKWVTTTSVSYKYLWMVCIFNSPLVTVTGFATSNAIPCAFTCFREWLCRGQQFSLTRSAVSWVNILEITKRPCMRYISDEKAWKDELLSTYPANFLYFSQYSFFCWWEWRPHVSTQPKSNGCK